MAAVRKTSVITWCFHSIAAEYQIRVMIVAVKGSPAEIGVGRDFNLRTARLVLNKSLPRPHEGE